MSTGIPVAPSSEQKPPPFGVGKTAKTGGAIPRVVDQLERRVDGAKRFKIRCNNYHPRPTKYVLAKTEKDAREHYLAVTGLDKEIERCKKNGMADIEQPDLVITELAD